VSASPVAWQRQPNGTWVAVVPSPSGTVIAAGAAASIIDAAGNIWALPSTGVVTVNGVPDSSTWGVTELAYVNGSVYQSNGTTWNSKSVPLWTAGAAPVLPTTGTATVKWTPPTTNTDGSKLTDLTSYTISYGPSSASLVDIASVPAPASSYVITGLAAGTWFFAVKAVNSLGKNSARTNIVSKTIT
jgi:hypothetical protein